MATPTYTKSGTKAATAAKLDKSVFGLDVVNHQLVKDAYVAYLAEGRHNLAVTKTRGLVRGGGRKPWRQKGTGRARFGSTRNPIWRGGGVAFGPTGQENFTKKLPSKAKRQAVRQALSLSATAGKVSVIEAIDVKDAKTATLARLLAKVEAANRILLVVEDKTPELLRAAANLAEVRLIRSAYLNVFDILNADRILFTQGALDSCTKALNQEKAS